MPFRLPVLRRSLPLLFAAAVGAQSLPETSAEEGGADSTAPAEAAPAVQGKAIPLGATQVRRKALKDQIKEQPYDVGVVDLRRVENNNATVLEALTSEAGVRVRESGGMGSGYNVSLNGLSGRSVRFFLDGVPMDQYGSAFGLHALPVNLLSRVEVYKGVVPPHFGSDALGGVVNLVTKDVAGSFVDAAYTKGSFGLNQATGMAGWSDPESPWFVTARAAAARVDNDYEVYGEGVTVADPVTYRTVPYRGKRFHDAYRAWSLQGEAGVRGTDWADRFSVQLMHARDDKELQHGNTMANVYGEATRRSDVWSPSAVYRKRGFLHENLELSLYASRTLTMSTLVDTASRRYDWSGAVVYEHPGSSELGSGNVGKSMLELKNVNQLHQAGLAWDFWPGQQLMLHGTFDATTRTGEDPLGGDRSAGYREPQELRKIVTSLSHRLRLFGDRYTQYAWVKNYDFNVSTVNVVYLSDSMGWGPRPQPLKINVNNTGYGYASTTGLVGDLKFKLSGEKTYRLPDAEELLGDGVFTRPAPFLEPERSYNLNAGLIDTRIPLFGEHRMSLEGSAFYRWTEDQIVFSVQSNSGVGNFVNVGEARGAGVSGEAGYRYARLFEALANVTYQDLRDKRRRNGIYRNLTYDDRLPNLPYLMANANAGLSFQGAALPNDALKFSWSYGYVHAFYLNWPSLGSANTKAEIPAQHVHDLGVTYSLAKQRFNVGFDVKNVFDEQVYDNYMLQKPGREYSLKVRTFFSSLQ